MTRSRNLYPVIPFFMGHQTSAVSATSSQYLKWNTILYNTGHFKYKTNTTRVYVNKDTYGLYRIKVELTTRQTTATTAHFELRLYKNGNRITSATSGFSSYERDNSGTGYEFYNYGSLEYFLELQKGDYISVQLYMNAGVSTSEIVANTSRIIIEFIPVYGFNNGSGGRMIFKGGIIR